MQLASALQDPAIELADLERLISADVGLSYRLLKYINSAYFGLRGRISSIKQAVALLGIEPLRRWATLTIFADLGDKPRELFITALDPRAVLPARRRGRGRSAVGAVHARPVLRARCPQRHLDAHRPANLPFTPSMRDALIDHTGPGRLLDCVMAIEQGDFERANKIVDGASQHYLDAVAWSNDKGKQLIG